MTKLLCISFALFVFGAFFSLFFMVIDKERAVNISVFVMLISGFSLITIGVVALFFMAWS